MKVKRISTTSEVIAHHQLEKGLEDSNYIICPKLLLKEVIDSSLNSYLTKSQRKFIEVSHFDFLVADFYHYPLFAVEFDVPHHLVYEKTIQRDIMKNRICQMADFPPLSISDVELEEHDKISILQFMVHRHVKWKQEEEFRELTEDGF